MSKKFIPFDGEIARKQPEKIVYADGTKPDDIAIFNNGEVVTKHKGIYYKHNPDGKGVFKDLFLLPEFTPEEGKWYWVQEAPLSKFKPMEFDDGKFWQGDYPLFRSDFYYIYPEPIPQTYKPSRMSHPIQNMQPGYGIIEPYDLPVMKSVTVSNYIGAREVQMWSDVEGLEICEIDTAIFRVYWDVEYPNRKAERRKVWETL